MNKKELFWAGFFIGIFWFYWISFSFRYYDLSLIIPFVILGVALICAFIFWALGLLRYAPLKAIGILLLSYIEPFGFNWLKPELTLINSYIGTEKWQFALFLSAILICYGMHFMKSKKRYLALLPAILLFAFSLNSQKEKPSLPDQKIYLHDGQIAQDKKWEKEYAYEVVRDNMDAIKKAIKEKYDIIVLSESAFPFYLNKAPKLLKELKILSKKITIVTGGLNLDKGKLYNSTFYFIDGKMSIVDKVLLVPFGEEIPLPKFIGKYINKIFFDGAEDYDTAKKVSNIKIGKTYYRNAICYEATKDKLFENSPGYMIAISNNAWFTPSIEPTLQNLLLKYYSRKYKTVIFHSANMGISGVVR